MNAREFIKNNINKDLIIKTLEYYNTKQITPFDREIRCRLKSCMTQTDYWCFNKKMCAIIDTLKV